MAANAPSGPIQQIGSDAAPIVVDPGSSKTWTHGTGKRAAAIWAVTPTNRRLIDTKQGALGALVITQPSVNEINLDNGPLGPVSCILFVEWEIPSASAGAATASAFI